MIKARVARDFKVSLSRTVIISSSTVRFEEKNFV